MSNIIDIIAKEQIKTDLPHFKSGDTVIVNVKVTEGNRTRLQAFEGVVIAKKNRGINSAFTVRKISHGEGVERTFQTHSPLIDSIIVKRSGDVRKAKLYHLRKLSGKAARIKEKLNVNKDESKTASTAQQQSTSEASTQELSSENKIEESNADLDTKKSENIKKETEIKETTSESSNKNIDTDTEINEKKDKEK